MKIGLQLKLLPGDTHRDRAQWAQDHGVDGIELGVWNGGLPKMRRQAEEIGGRVPICSVCGNADTDNHPSFDFLDPDPVKRRKSIDGALAILEFCREVGAVGQVAPPTFGPPRVPDLSPFKTPRELEDELMYAACRDIGPFAAERGVLFMLEPLNRYEQHYLRRQADAVRVIETVGAPGIGLLSDLFHMHIEETNTPRALEECARYITEVHLADNTRMEPGTGDLDFTAAFRPLVRAGFAGYMVYECNLSGDSPREKAAHLTRSLEFVRECVELARG